MTTRQTRHSVELAGQSPAVTRSTRHSVELAGQSPAVTRATRISVEVAIGSPFPFPEWKLRTATYAGFDRRYEKRL